jgi:hypothetical protein
MSITIADTATAVAQACDRYYQAWKSRDFGSMYAATQKTWASKDGNSAEILEQLHPAHLTAYQMGTPLPVGECLWQVPVSLVVDGVDRKATPTVICEVEPYKPDLRGDWGVNPISALRLS